MTKRTQEFEAEVFEAVRLRPYIELPPIIQNREIVTIKLRFRVRPIPDGFVQFYYNEINGRTSLALVMGNARSYGHDYVSDKGWHKHTWPQGNHDYSEEARQPITVHDFMERVDEIINYGGIFG
ncbi:hypothetical protein KKE26_09840 [bacterium]|nr:hypothetical protein [bacterium]MBU1753002.1 hypothetical protein [bacterium]